MTAAGSYAKALHDVSSKDESKAAQYLKNLRVTLERRGHLKLMPAILSEYEKLDLAVARSKSRSTVTAESERTRALLELYRRLIAAE